MEAVKVANQGSATHDSVAIRSDWRSYGYNQLMSSASSISSLLSSRHLNAQRNKGCTKAGTKIIKTYEAIGFGLQTSKASKHEFPSSAIDGGRGQGHLVGSRIGIVAKPSAEFVAGILGTWLSGGVAVPLALSSAILKLSSSM